MGLRRQNSKFTNTKHEIIFQVPPFYFLRFSPRFDWFTCLLGLSSSLSLLPHRQVLLNRLDHLISYLRRLGEPWLEVRLDLLKLRAVAVHVA